MNKFIGMGNLTRDPELRYTPNGAAVTSFGIAMNRNYKDSEGNKREEVTFIDVEAWGKAGELVNQYFKKGNPIIVEGSLVLDTWQTEDGQKRSRHKIRLQNINFLPKGSKKNDTEEAAVASGEDTDSESIPF